MKGKPRWYPGLLLLATGCGVLSHPGLAGLALKTPTALAQNRPTPVQSTEVHRLFQRGNQQFRRSQFREALANYTDVLGLHRERGDRLGEAEVLYQLGVTYRILGQYPQAREQVEEGLAIVQELEKSVLVVRFVAEMGVIHYSIGQYPQALEYYQQAVTMARSLGDRQTEAHTLDHMGIVYRRQGEYRRSLELHQQAWEISEDIGDREVQDRILNNIGVVYDLMGEYAQALEYDQKALLLSRETGDRFIESRILSSIGVVYSNLGEYDRALDYYQQALAIERDIGNRAEEGRTVNNIGTLYNSQGNYPKALEYYQESLALRRDIGDRAGEGTSLANIGLVYWNVGQYDRALDYYQQALAIYREVGEKKGEAYALSSLAGLDYSQGNYARALASYREAANLRQEIGDKAGLGYSFNSIGGVHYTLGQYEEAIAFYQQALTIRQEIGDRAGKAVTLNNLGLVFDLQQNYDEALAFYQQSLALRRDLGDRSGEASTLNNMGLIYNVRGQYPEALEVYQQALAIRQDIGEPAGVANTIGNLGILYDRLQQYPQAIDAYQQALGIFKTLGDRAGERLALANIGYTLIQQNRPELAIIFYKKSVNITEEIRQELQGLPQTQQASYTQTVAETYRTLADLLLSQGRVLEAQQVLELLKIEELREFTGESRSGGQTTRIAFSEIEQEILAEHGTLTAFGQQIEQCRQTRCPQLSQLLDRRDVLTQQYNQTLQTLEAEIRQRRAVDDAFLDPTHFSRKAQEIVEAQPGTVLIYPLVTEDKIWLLWATHGGIVKSIEIPDVGQQQLGEVVLKFRQLLVHYYSDLRDLQTQGKQLYDWLIKPLEQELKASNIQNLVFSLDRVTRYIPMAALFDGEQYLIENYAISTILSADLTDTSDRLPPARETSVLALGLSEAVERFTPLPNVPNELDAIVRKDAADPQGVYPGLEFLNQDFDFRALRDNLFDRDILHIATHGDFVPGLADESYLLLGTGEKLAIPQITTLQDLVGIHLVVLSACETALGSPGADGTEIAGLSYYFLNSGAKAVAASLWLVNDASTSLLMQEFYQNLAQETMTKTEALRQAQLSFLGRFSSTVREEERGIGIVSEPGSSSRETFPNYSNFAHPYYWAPFILIGNGL